MHEPSCKRGGILVRAVGSARLLCTPLLHGRSLTGGNRSNGSTHHTVARNIARARGLRSSLESSCERVATYDSLTLNRSVEEYPSNETRASYLRRTNYPLCRHPSPNDHEWHNAVWGRWTLSLMILLQHVIACPFWIATSVVPMVFPQQLGPAISNFRMSTCSK